jgi:hypothetical protein
LEPRGIEGDYGGRGIVEKRGNPAYLRIGNLAIRLQDRNTGYGPEAIHGDVS